ncbi:MAG: GH3 auxin-responsive promoter family protein [Bacteroidia bacterium]|nr:GH3 auxin-responsive promoter family protein [Bacteroidia bacterium]
MLLLVHKIAYWILRRRLEYIEHFTQYPVETQQRVFRHLLEKGRDTVFGDQYGFSDIRTLQDFRRQVPISSYEQLFPFIDRAFKGEPNILWPGKVHWFSKSSGTTNDKSKYIPLTQESLDDCHYRLGQDMLAIYLNNKPESKLFTGKSLSIGGSLSENPNNRSIHFGDVSAVLTENLPRFYELVRTPGKSIALMSSWEEKVVAMAREVMYEDVTSIVGVPTWTQVLIYKIFELLEMKDHNLLEVWPNLELFLHGGVSFDPYREHFKSLIPSENMTYMDCYNASEGFFALQDDFSRLDLLLMLDYGIFFEFIPIENVEEDHPQTYTLEEVETNRNYAMVITTNGGLWRYLIGDTVMFTSLYPFRIKITGRTKHFINAFGEELMVDNAEKAISEASFLTGARVENYTAAPIFFEGGSRGGHEWLIEFEKIPEDLEKFGQILDDTLKSVNSDYEAKRKGDLALGPPLIHVLPSGSFIRWMKKRGKLGGQHKVPRLANNRDYLEDILKMIAVGS